MENQKSVLKESGLDLSDAVQAMIYYTNMSRPDLYQRSVWAVFRWGLSCPGRRDDRSLAGGCEGGDRDDCTGAIISRGGPGLPESPAFLLFVVFQIKRIIQMKTRMMQFATGPTHENAGGIFIGNHFVIFIFFILERTSIIGG